jgi:hypothetical protein
MKNKKTWFKITQVILKISEKSYRKQIKKIIESNFQLNKCWRMELEKHKLKKRKRKQEEANLS